MPKYISTAAFSLFEIIIVVAVIMSLFISSYIVVPRQILKARDADRKTDLKLISRSLEEYYNDTGAYPLKLPACGQPLLNKNQVVMTKIPCDPNTGLAYYYISRHDGGQSYKLYAKLENESDSIIETVGCLGGCGLDCQYNYGVSSSNVSLTKCSYVCAPGGGKSGTCELFQNTDISVCPKIFINDSTCNNQCSNSAMRCANSSGKNVPY